MFFTRFGKRFSKPAIGAYATGKTYLTEAGLLYCFFSFLMRVFTMVC
jgi:hypothetical protein